ncbi:MAG TPA: hypothetical protein VFC71_00430 [Candidatus Polarisedimenticolia bacterium]|nr:hypothetical protein [Candidatus Polarisedimenticolia bacterium]
MPGGRFDPSELAGADGGQASDIELAAVTSIAREIESRRGAADARPSPGFADRVMSAIASEPAPRVAGWFRGGSSLAGLAANVRAAWQVAVAGGGRPLNLRVAALAYVLVVALGVTAIGGVAAFGAAGALGLFDSEPSPAPSPPAETFEPSPSASPTPGPTVEPSPAPGTSPSASPEETAEPTASDGLPSASPDESEAPGSVAPPSSEASDEPDSSDDHGGSTPEPSDTPKPSGSGGSG